MVTKENITLKKPKKKISKSIKGEKHPFYGTHLSEETKSKISKANKEKTNYWKGKKLSEEHIGESVSGEKNGMYGKGTPVICVETKQVYPSVGIAAQAVGLKSKTAISNVINGRAKTSKGFHWMKLEEYEKKKIWKG